MAMFAEPKRLAAICALCNSNVAQELLSAVAPTLNLGVGEVGKLPVVSPIGGLARTASALASNSKEDWDDLETSWEFVSNPLVELSERG